LGPRPRLHLPLLIEGQAESLRLIESVERPDGSRRRERMLMAFPDDDYEHVNTLRFWMLTVIDQAGDLPRDHSQTHSHNPTSGSFRGSFSLHEADLLSIMKSYDRRHDYRPT